MATSGKLQQAMGIFTEEKISRNTFYVLMIVCLGYVMHTDTFESLVKRKDLKISQSDANGAHPTKIKVAAASMGGFFESEKRPAARKKVGGSSRTSSTTNSAAVAVSVEILASSKMVQSYIKRYGVVAKIEEKEMAIPASIILAQGILESAAGSSKSAQMLNNHFAKTCHKKNCKKDHCRNVLTESRKDFYIVYQNAWQSYRAHSQSMYSDARFERLYRIPTSDYKTWAKGLERAGYSEDKNYAAKLIYLIETYKLNRI